MKATCNQTVDKIQTEINNPAQPAPMQPVSHNMMPLSPSVRRNLLTHSAAISFNIKGKLRNRKCSMSMTCDDMRKSNESGMSQPFQQKRAVTPGLSIQTPFLCSKIMFN
jgi:hypothetical protein